MFILEAAPVVYQPITFQKDYAQMKREGSGTFLLGGHKYKIVIRPKSGLIGTWFGPSKYITEVSQKKEEDLVKVAFKDRRELKKLLKNPELLQEQFNVDENFRNTISSNLKLLRSMELETLLELEELASSDQEKEKIEEDIQKEIASAEDAAKELSECVNDLSCPPLLKDGILWEMAKIYNHYYQRIVMNFRDLILNTQKYKQYEQSVQAISEKYEALSERNNNISEEKLANFANEIEGVEQELQRRTRTFNIFRSYKEFMKKFSPSSFDSENQSCAQYHQEKNLFEQMVNMIEKNAISGIERLLKLSQEIQNKLPSPQTTSQATEQIINKNEDNQAPRAHVTFTMPNNNHKML